MHQQSSWPGPCWSAAVVLNSLPSEKASQWFQPCMVFRDSVTKIEAASLPGPSHARVVSFSGVSEPLPRPGGPFLPSDAPPPAPSPPTLSSLPRSPASSSDAERLRFCLPFRSLL